MKLFCIIRIFYGPNLVLTDTGETEETAVEEIDDCLKVVNAELIFRTFNVKNQIHITRKTWSVSPIGTQMSSHFKRDTVFYLIDNLENAVFLVHADDRGGRGGDKRIQTACCSSIGVLRCQPVFTD